MFRLWTITDEHGRFALVVAKDSDRAYELLQAKGWPPEWQLDFSCIGGASHWLGEQVLYECVDA